MDRRWYVSAHANRTARVCLCLYVCMCVYVRVCVVSRCMGTMQTGRKTMVESGQNQTTGTADPFAGVDPSLVLGGFGGVAGEAGLGNCFPADRSGEPRAAVSSEGLEALSAEVEGRPQMFKTRL